MRQETKRDPENEPRLENYPPLAEWIAKHAGRPLWGVDVGPDMRAEGWWFHTSGPGVMVITLHADRKGWEIYTPADTNAIDASLLDAEERIGL